METRVVKDKEGNISIIASKDGKTTEFKQFRREISIGCLLMEHRTSIDFTDDSWDTYDHIFCRAVMPNACVSVSNIKTILDNGYDGLETTFEDITRHREEISKEKSTLDNEALYHNLLEDNENIAVSIKPAKDGDGFQASLHYYPWAIYALQGKADFYHQAKMILQVPSEIYDDIKAKVLNGPPMYKFIINVVPEILKMSTDKPEDIARNNALFSQENDVGYSLLFSEEVGFQHLKINSIYYDCDPVEIKKPSTVASFGSWKGANLADALNEKIAEELQELKKITEKEIKKQTSLLQRIDQTLYNTNNKKKWWF